MGLRNVAAPPPPMSIVNKPSPQEFRDERTPPDRPNLLRRGSSLLPWAIRRGLIEERCCSFPLPGPAVESTRPVRRRNSPESTGTAWGGPIDATDFRRDPPCRLRTLGAPGPHPRRRLRRLACGREGAELPAQLPDDRRIRARRSRAPGAQGRPGSPLPILRADARRGGFRRAAAGRPGPRVPAVGRRSATIVSATRASRSRTSSAGSGRTSRATGRRGRTAPTLTAVRCSRLPPSSRWSPARS